MVGVLVIFSILTLSSCESDKEHPVIRLQGPDSMLADFGVPFDDPGVIAFDNQDFDISDQVVIGGNLNFNYLGNYQVHYSVTDKSGNPASAYRDVSVVANPKSLV